MSYIEPTSPTMTSPRRLTNRNTNRYSVTALFSMAAEQDVEVEDDLARGTLCKFVANEAQADPICSTKASERPQRQDIGSVEKELCSGARRALPGLAYRAAYPEQNGA